MFEDLPQPRLFVDNNKVFLMMEHNGKEAWERIPSQFLKMDDDQRAFLLANLNIVQKLFKKLGLKLPKRVE